MNEELLTQINTLLETAPEEVRGVILNGDINSSIASLSVIYHLTIDEATAIQNTIVLTLLGIIPVAEVEGEITKHTSLSEPDRKNLLKDIDVGIFEKARVKLFGEEIEKGYEVRNLSVGEEKSKDELRAQIMSHADRTPPAVSVPVKTTDVPPSPPAAPSLPRSRDELLERMDVLNTIPKTEQVEERLAKIQAQSQVTRKVEQEEQKEVPLPEPLPEIKEKVVFPEEYNVDPYRETPV